MKMVFRLRSLTRSLASVGIFLGVISGAATAFAEPGITPHSIIIGQSAGITGAAGPDVIQTTEGAKLYFDIINKQGGILGRKIELVSIDDGFDPVRTAANTQKLITEKNAFALFLYRGTPTTEAILPMLSAARIPLIAPVSGALSLHEPVNHYLFTVRSKYKDEVITAVDQLYQMGLRSFGAFISHDSFGADALEGLKQGMAKHQLAEPLISYYERNSVEVSDSVNTMIKNKPQAVLMFCTAKACSEFVKGYRKAGGMQQLITLSNVSSASFIKGLEKDSRGLGITQVFPNPENSTVPICKELQMALKDRKDLTNSGQRQRVKS